MLLLGACKTAQTRASQEKPQPESVETTLNNRWLLNTINDEPIENSAKEIFLEFRLPESRFFGNAGCNSFNGQIEIKESQLKIGHVLATRKYCIDNMELEDRLIGMLNQSEWIVELNDHQLILSNAKNKLEFNQGEKETE